MERLLLKKDQEIVRLHALLAVDGGEHGPPREEAGGMPLGALLASPRATTAAL